MGINKLNLCNIKSIKVLKVQKWLSIPVRKSPRHLVLTPPLLFPEKFFHNEIIIHTKKVDHEILRLHLYCLNDQIKAQYITIG